MTRSKSGKSKASIPPYVSYKTFSNFSSGLKGSVPPVIDRTVMKTMGGSTQTQLLSALRYLGLVDEENNAMEIYTRFIEAGEDQERQKALKSILTSAYPFLLKSADFDIANAAPSQFEQKFKDAGATGETVRKCGLFFLMAAKEAGITVSRHIGVPSGRGESSAPRPRNSSRTKGVRTYTLPETPSVSPISPTATYLTLMNKLVENFPPFDPSNSPTEKAKWHDNFKELMEMVREVHPRKSGEDE